MLRISSARLGRSAPTLVGIVPLFAVLAGTCVGVGACSNSGSPGDQITPPIDLGMTPKMAPYYQDENITILESQMPVPLPVRKPTASDLSGLGAAPKGTGYPRAPYLTAGDESIEVHYTISNLDSQSHSVWLLIDPWNEFVRWNPGVTIVSDEETEPNWGYDLSFLVEGQSRIEGTITSDDMQEIAIKLASVENMLASPEAKAADEPDASADAADDPNAASPQYTAGFDPAATANNIMNPQNRSNGGDPLYTPWIPPVIAGLTGFDLGLRSYDAATLAIEITIEIKDENGNRFVQYGSSAAQLGVPPKTLTVPGSKM
jgi:hypothetical protein